MTVPRIAKDDVCFLSFEGGGGAGNIYPGALKALADPSIGILRYDPQRAGMPPTVSVDAAPTGVDWKLRPPILGVSGASAGAINALFLASGYSPPEIEHILATNDFNQFFDDIVPGLIPCVGGFRHGATAPDPQALLEEFRRTPAGVLFSALGGGGIFAQVKLQALSAAAVGEVLSAALVVLSGLLYPMPRNVIQQLVPAVADRRAQRSAMSDLGLFPGIEIRRFFARYLAVAVERVVANDPRYALRPITRTYAPASSTDVGSSREFFDRGTNEWVRTSEITFWQHQRIFGTSLLVTGTNLETGKSHFFSADTTPRFRVVDAVRISMSLPGIFKPLILHDDADLAQVITPGETPGKDHYLRGVWVDGGYLNNMPVTAFDHRPHPDDPLGPAVGPGRTLGLAVGLETRTEINSLLGFLAVYPFGMGVFGTGSSQVSATTSPVDRMIILDAHDPATGQSIELLDFVPDPTLYANLNAQSHRQVTHFFAP